MKKIVKKKLKQNSSVMIFCYFERLVPLCKIYREIFTNK